MEKVSEKIVKSTICIQCFGIVALFLGLTDITPISNLLSFLGEASLGICTIVYTTMLFIHFNDYFKEEDED